MRAGDIRITGYDDARRQLRGKKSKRLCGNTVLTWQRFNAWGPPHECAYVRLHDTRIVRYWRDGLIVLNTEGHWTQVTKRRINQCLPEGYLVYQERHQWMLRREGSKDRPTKVRYFEDKMELQGPRAAGEDGRT